MTVETGTVHKGMFLDRDGVINEVLTKRVKFVNDPDDLFLFAGVPRAIRTFNHLGFKVFVITNQGGIGLGYMTEKTLDSVHKAMIGELAQSGARIDDIAFCPHKPNAGCPCRKPKPKMIFDLAKRYKVDLSASWMVGDRKPDIEAGKAAGTGTILIGDRSSKSLAAEADHTFLNLAEAADWFMLAENG